MTHRSSLHHKIPHGAHFTPAGITESWDLDKRPRKRRTKAKGEQSETAIKVEPIKERPLTAMDVPDLAITGICEATQDLRNGTHAQCRWPIGDPRDPLFHYCQDNHLKGQPYCEAHLKRRKGRVTVAT